MIRDVRVGYRFLQTVLLANCSATATKALSSAN
jgi:hypothetical protein